MCPIPVDEDRHQSVMQGTHLGWQRDPGWPRKDVGDAADAWNLGFVSMKAIVQDRYGPPDVLALADIPDPAASADQVLVEVIAASIGAGVGHLLTADIPLVRLAYGLRRPRHRPGIAFAGTIVAVGTKVPGLQVGDVVCGTSTGAFAQLVTARPDRIASVPPNVDPVAASTIPVSAVTALQAVRDLGEIQRGQQVLVTGASGGVGSFAVQLAHLAGAEVTAVCGPAHAALVNSLGAAQVIDYSMAPVTGTFDVILDIAGALPFAQTRSLLTREGTLVCIGAAAQRGGAGGLDRTLRAGLLSPFTRQRLRAMIQSENSADVAAVCALLADGAIRAVIQRTFPLAATAEALRYYLAESIGGSVVITMGGGRAADHPR